MNTTSESIKNKAVRAATQTASTKKPLNLNNTSMTNQHAIIIAELAEGNKTSIWLKEQRGIMQIGARIHELRHMGNVIKTSRIDAYTSDGSKHKGIAEYALVKMADHD